MKSIAIGAALAVIGLASWSAPAHANQTLTFQIVGAGRITADPGNPQGDGVDCRRAPGDAAASGNCDELVVDGPEICQETCQTQPGLLTFKAEPADGFELRSWSHPQCPNVAHPPNPPAPPNPCTVLVALGGPFPPLPVTATFADTQQPTATLTSPADRAAVRGVIALTATATDNAGVARLVFRVRGNPLAHTFEVPPFATTFDTTTQLDGPATFSATATDAVGLSGASTANVTIDNTKPTLGVTGPDGQTFGPGATPTWAINAADATTAVTVQCSVVPVGQPAIFHACTSATQERLVNQPDGRYMLTVRASDAAGNAVEQTRTFGIDTGPPETTIDSGPGDGSTTTATALTWGFRASEPARFECRLYLTAIGPGAFAPCSAAAAHSVAGLAPGGYTFEARATDVFGNVDPTPARRTVTVALAPPPPPPPPPLPPPPPPPILTVALTFSFDRAGGHAIKLTSLVVSPVPKGATVTAVCPKGCAKQRLIVRNAQRKVSLLRLTRRKPLKARTKIVVTVTKPGAVSAVKVLEVRRRGAPTVETLCRPPGAAKPRACA